MRVELLGHLGVGLEERLGRDQERRSPSCSRSCGAPASSAVSPPCGALAEPRGLGPEQALAVDRVDQRVDVELAGRGDEADLELAGAAALADDEVAQEAPLVAPVPGAQALARGSSASTCSRAALPRSEASMQSSSGRISVEAAGRVEAAHQLAVLAGAERVLELVAVAPLLDRRDDRLELVALEAADAGQRVLDLLLLDLELALVGQHLPRRARVVGDLGDAVGRGLEDLDRARLGVGALGLADHGADAVAGHGAGDEDDVAVSRRATPLPP